MKQKLFILSTLLPVFFLLLSCSDESGADTPPAPVPAGYITVEILVPGATNVSTRDLSAIDECEVQTIDVLVFDAATDKFLYYRQGHDITTTPGDEEKKEFKLEITQDGNHTSIHLMVIANAAEEVSNALKSSGPGFITTSTSWEDVTRKLKFTVEDPWPVKPGKFTRFPMWGLSQNISLSEAITVPTINLIRSVAKIDVGICFNGSDVPQGLDNMLKLEDIRVYNAHKEQFIAPDPNNLSGSVVTAPSVPTTAGVNDLMYKLRDPSHNKFGHINEIYVSEHAGMLSPSDNDKDLFLVIGARYGSEESDITYYRVDFVKTTSSGKTTTLPILRNHRYRVNITAVHGPGYNNINDAIRNIASNLEVEITDTDLSLTDINTDGRYILGVSKGSFVFDKEERTGVSVIVNTTWKDGWEATSNDTDWLKITSAPGASPLTFKVTNYGTGTKRTGTITVNAIGRTNLKKIITVDQYAINAIETEEEKEPYQMGGSVKSYSFKIKSVYDWQVKIQDSENILRTFDTSGKATPGGSIYKFTLGNSTVADVATATLTFYSLTNEFTSVEVEIKGKN